MTGTEDTLMEKIDQDIKRLKEKVSIPDLDPQVKHCYEILLKDAERQKEEMEKFEREWNKRQS